jgi:hypothetical protein
MNFPRTKTGSTVKPFVIVSGKFRFECEIVYDRIVFLVVNLEEVKFPTLCSSVILRSCTSLTKNASTTFI